MRCAVYIRVSGKQQVKGVSLDDQLRACREYALRQGWSIIEPLYVEPGRSAFVDQVYLKHGAVLGIRPTLRAWPLMHAVYAQSLQSVGWWAGWVSGRPFKHTASDSDVRGAAKESRAGKRLWITNSLSGYSCTHLYPQAQAFL